MSLAADKIRYSVGYRLPDLYDNIADIVTENADGIDEVYFAMPGKASGRSPVGLYEGITAEQAAPYVYHDLQRIRSAGVRLTLLHNAACYGAEAASKTLANRTIEETGQMVEKLGITAVTTTSPYLAKTLKSAFPALEIRASVNMRIGTVEAMEVLQDFFDGFYMQREYNRSPAHIRRLRKWCDDHGKRLYMLVNSGCLRWCPFQSFHDNMVAHEAQSDLSDYGMEVSSYCRSWMRSTEHYLDFVRATWIRPEDMPNYAGLFDGYKLATRLHPNPRRVIESYIRGSFMGSVTELTEPGFQHGNVYLDNTLFPKDWFEKTSDCSHECENCGYCKAVMEKVHFKL